MEFLRKVICPLATLLSLRGRPAGKANGEDDDLSKDDVF
jgi:hypothetical protein